ncbi:hypothetical protein ETU08_10330 [Apibacter muscae]|uniref:hypothetical protein n=1 Tax=Apibacter muscae TaxID=2509004 RepID=UPI0011AD6A6B|nr:hypothetical protein [Apibacter muscae]TWP22864.1 hypothetical protein ETU10_09715 [Apibacter muscae]TWP28099.1 hypothetical protein ETU08_10330 [Apibacter muscae]
MKENLKYAVKLSAVAIKSFIKVNFLGGISTILFTILGLLLLIKDMGNVQTGHVNPTIAFVILFTHRPTATILIVLGIISSPFIFFTLGNKYIISKLSNKIINDKAENFIYPFIDKILNIFQKNQPKIIQNAADFSMNKLKIIQTIKENKETNKWIRRIVAFGMNKVHLSDIDFNHGNQNFNEILKNKTLQSLKNISEPSLKFVWIAIAIQWIIILYIWLF